MADLTQQVKPRDVISALRSALMMKLPVFMWGSPGIGKSDIVHKLGEEFNAPVIDVRLSLWEPTDIKGIPYYCHETKTMVWAPPSELPNMAVAAKHPYIILFLDEMNSAPQSVLAAAYQLVLNRRVGQYVLPDNVLIVAAGNRETDGGVTSRMPKPLANRFTHIEMTHDFDDWAIWAVDANIHHEVLGYLYAYKGDLYDFDPKSPAKAFPTPRSWEKVSDIVQHVTDEKSLRTLIAGTIGDGTAIKFITHREISGKLPKAVDILAGIAPKLTVDKISAQYALAVSCCYELRECLNKQDPELSAKMDNYILYAKSNFKEEITIVSVRIALQQYGLPLDQKSKAFIAFVSEFKEFVIGAFDQR